MRLKKPKLYKKYLSSFADERGYLNPLSLDTLFKKKELVSFQPKYQLVSYTESQHTFRGFHYQKPPSEQTKILIVHAGKILDIVFPYDSLKIKHILSFDLEAGDILIIPNNYAHGFYTKSSNVLLQYIMDKEYVPIDYTGFNGIEYISKKTQRNDVIISETDANLPEVNFD